MRYATLGCGLLLLLVAWPAGAQECPTGKPTLLTRALPRALGPGPLWVMAESWPIKWKASGAPVQLIWVIDASVPGQAIVMGKHRESGLPIRFTAFGDTLGERQLRHQIDPFGYKPSLARPEDFTKYSFDRSYVWFPEPGCYELTGRVGRQQATIHLEAVKSAGK